MAPVVGQDEAGDTSLSLFPADPELPTLAAAMDLSALSRNDWPCPTAEPTSVELVHHSRQGPAVLRYGVRRTDSSAASRSARSTGRSIRTGPPDSGSTVSWNRFPDPAGTGSDVSRLLLWAESRPDRGASRTSCAAGHRAVRGAYGRTGASTGHSAYEAAHASGQALAALHSIRDATAPEVTVRHLIRDLEFQLTVVQQVWPEVADDVRSRLDRLEIMDRLTEGVGAGAVLSHGDFTPSQVLFAGDTVCGVVDFDTVCWGEEAMDLGRFLAQLDLVVTKDAGRSADHLRDRLAEGFVSGYSESPGVAGDDESLRERIGLFRSLSLASTALHACRQLKQRRLNLALSLLSLPTYNSDPLEPPQKSVLPTIGPERLTS